MVSKGGLLVWRTLTMSLLILLWTEAGSETHEVTHKAILGQLKAMVVQVKSNPLPNPAEPFQDGTTCMEGKPANPTLEELKRDNPAEYERKKGKSVFKPTDSEAKEYNALTTEAFGNRCKSGKCILDGDSQIICGAKSDSSAKSYSSAKSFQPILVCISALGLELLRRA